MVRMSSGHGFAEGDGCTAKIAGIFHLAGLAILLAKVGLVVIEFPDPRMNVGIGWLARPAMLEWPIKR